MNASGTRSRNPRWMTSDSRPVQSRGLARREIDPSMPSGGSCELGVDQPSRVLQVLKLGHESVAFDDQLVTLGDVRERVLDLRRFGHLLELC